MPNLYLLWSKLSFKIGLKDFKKFIKEFSINYFKDNHNSCNFQKPINFPICSG